MGFSAKWAPTWCLGVSVMPRCEPKTAVGGFLSHLGMSFTPRHDREAAVVTPMREL